MKKNQLILLSMLGAMATPLAIQPAQASSAVEMRMNALAQQKKEEEAAKAKAASEAQAAKQKKMSSVVAVENKDVQSELNALISDINSNLGAGLKVVATADKDGLKAGVQEIDKALKTAVAEKKALEADLATLKTDVEALLTSISGKSGNPLVKPADSAPKTLSASLKLADTDVKGLVMGGGAVNLAPLQGDIDALIKSYNAKHTKAIGLPADDKPATLEASVKALDADLKGLVLVAPVDLKPLQTEIDALITSDFT
ncbi:MAG: hypothetical protein K2X53_04670 [Alphaproteobacteria bacterium]|nr:hypothetical protein [Alphaproteobacteria bacterium]